MYHSPYISNLRPGSGPADQRSHLLAILLIVILALAIAASPVHGQYDEIGGDDVLIATGNTFLAYSPSMDIAENGDIYVAIAVMNSTMPEIRVYRSQDAGDSWPLWGTISLAVAPALAIDFPCLHIGEGTQNRVYVAYRYRGPSDANYSIRVAWSALSPAAASWSSQEVFAQAGVDFQSPSLDSDEMSNANYRVFLVAMGSGVDGGDVWFSRSTSYGATWANEYPIFSSTTGANMTYPEIRYGRGGVVHCVCYENPAMAPSGDMAVRYRRAVSYAASILNWGSVTELTSNGNGEDEFHATVAASHASDKVVIGYALRNSSGVFQPAQYRWSTDAGATWPAGNANSTADNQLPHLLANDALNCVEGWGNVSGTDNFGVGSFRNDRTIWSTNRSHMDGACTGVPNTQTGGRYFDANATLGNRLGFVWMTYNSAGPDSLFFDAEWRRDPGYPNLESGFPVEVDRGTACMAAPALCELDSDPESEIVFGSADGNIHVYNHDGTIVPGWPVVAGAFDRNSTIAVGDITGTSENEVVAASMGGVIHAFGSNGTPLPGWPVDFQFDGLAYLAIGGITTAQRQVVVTSGTRVCVLNGDGSMAPNFPVLLTDFSNGGPAIGDLDGDGAREIVVTHWNAVSVITGNGSILVTRVFPGDFMDTTPALGDLDLDGDLEIVVTTSAGYIHVLNADGTDVPGWPWHNPTGDPMTGAALANINSLFQPEIIAGVWGQDHPEVHAFSAGGIEVPGFPRSQSPGNQEPPTPIVDVLDEGYPDIIRGAHDGTTYAWTDLGADLPGWPGDLGHSCLTTAASGDIDADGKVEVVMVTSWPMYLVIYDLGADVYRSTSNIRAWWPMFGYNPLRQSCLACDADAVSGVNPNAPPVETARFAPPRPNPSAAAVSLHFDLPAPAAVRLDIFDVNGRLVRRLMKTELPSGAHDAVWDGRGEGGDRAAAGSYYLRLTVNDGTAAPPLNRRVVLLK